MAIAPIVSDGPTFTVSNLEELHEAYDKLSYTDGGGTILLEPGDYGTFSRYPYGVEYEENPVIIRSADEADPATFTGISLRDVANVRIESIAVDSTDMGVGDKSVDLKIKDCTNIQIVDSTFTQDADSTLKDSGEVMDHMSSIRDSSDIVFSGNYVNGYLFALQVTEVENMEITDNEFTNIQGDGFRGGGLQNLTIDGNYFHDFYPVDQEVTHSDMIQIWGADSDSLTSGVTISNNIMMASDAATQSIFIRNEEFGDAGDPTATHFTDFTITNNLIYNGHRWGIHLDNIDGAVVDGNTLLYNPDAIMTHYGKDYTNAPEIFSRNSLDISVTNNIVGTITVPDGSIVEDNQIITFSDPTEPSHYGNHFVNPTAGNAISLQDLEMMVSSPFFGLYGSTIGNSPNDISDGARGAITASTSDGDAYEVIFDASASQINGQAIGDDPDYAYNWIFADGSTSEGISTSYTFDSGGFKPVTLKIEKDGEVISEVTRNFAIKTKDIFAFDFEEGTVDVSDGVPDIIDGGKTVAHDGDTGFLIGDGNKLEITRDTEEIHELETFGLALDLAPTGDEPHGVFVHLPSAMTGSVNEDGNLSFTLTTDTGTYSVESEDPVFDDGNAHRIGIAFDGTSGQLQLFADGKTVGSTEAWGTTAPSKYWGMTFGNTWNDSMDAVIDNVEMSTDPGIAGELPQVEAGGSQPPIQEPSPVAPVEIVNEPTVEVLQPTSPEVSQPMNESEDDDGGSSMISRLIEAILSIFGLGRDDDSNETEIALDTMSVSSSGQMLTDILPATEAADDASGDVDAEEDDAYLDAA